MSSRRKILTPRTSIVLSLLFLGALVALAQSSMAKEPPWPSLASPPQHIPNQQQAEEAMKRFVNHRLANGSYQVLVRPFSQDLTDGDLKLFLSSRIPEILPVSVEIVSAAGISWPVWTGDVAPQTFVEISLNKQFGVQDHSLQRGVVRVTYFGDAEMLQAWLIQQDEAGWIRFTLANATQETAWKWRSFWDLTHYQDWEGLTASYIVHNVDSSPVVVQVLVKTPNQDQRIKKLQRGLGPNQTLVLTPASLGFEDKRGKIEFFHDGEPGQVIITAVATGGGSSMHLPLEAIGGLGGYDEYYTPSLPLFSPTISASTTVRVHLLDTRASGKPQDVVVALLSLKGEEVSLAQTQMSPGEIDTLAFQEPYGLGGQRLSISTSEGQILAGATLASKNSMALLDVPLAPVGTVHDSGTYPIPNLDEYEVVTTWLNLGETPAQIFGHVFWTDGEHSLEPFEIPPGQAYRLSLNSLQDAAPVDLLDRAFEPGEHSAFFQWLSRRGSSALLAATQIRRKTDEDSLAFNCVQCCPEAPFGDVYPEAIAMIIGETRSFMAQEYISSCTGTLGPYYADPNTLNYSSPASWTGRTAAASDSTIQEVTFEGSGWYTNFTCQQSFNTFTDRGGLGASVPCQVKHNPGYDPTKGCPGMFPGATTAQCEKCELCCAKQQAVAECICNQLPFGRSICKALTNFFVFNKCIEACCFPSDVLLAH